MDAPKGFYAYSLPRFSSFSGYDAPFVETSTNFDPSQLGPPRSGRSICVAGQQYRMESPNSNQTPYYPGSGVQVSDVCGLPARRFFDGQLGPGDYSLSPQFFCPKKPWLPFIRRKDESMGQIDSESTHVRVYDIWTTEYGAAYRGSLKTKWIHHFIRNHLSENSTMEHLIRENKDLPRCMLQADILWPHEEDLENLYQITLYEEAVDWVRRYQRALLCKRAWVEMAMHWKSHSYENDTVERCDRSANDDMIGVYLNGRQISAPFVNWYLTLGVPCFYVIDVVHKPLPEPIHLSFSAGTPIQALMSGSTYLYDSLADRDGCKVAAEGFRWPGDKWTMQRIATMRKYLVSRYPKHFIPHEHLPDPQSASMLKRINEKKRRPPSEVIRCMRPQQPQRREPEVESDSGSTESDSEGRDTDSQSDSGESESDSVGRDTDSQSDSGRNIAHSPSQSGSNIEADEDRTPEGNPPKDTAPSPELGSNVEADEDGTRDGNPPKDTAPSPELGSNVEADEDGTPKDTAPSPELGFLYPQDGKGAVQITMREFDILRSSKRFLNDKVVDFFLRLRFAEFEQEQPCLSKETHIVSSFLHTLFELRKFEAVQRWTNAISGLNASHWFLAIFNSSEAESRLWILDSMRWKNRRAVKVLLDYLHQEAAAHNAEVKPPIVGYVKVPKQLGNVLCGDNVIHFASMFLQKPDFYLEKFKEDISLEDMWEPPSNNLRVWLRRRMDEVINNDYPHLRPALAPFTPNENEIIELDDSGNEIIELDDSDDAADDHRPGPGSIKDQIVKLDSDVADGGKEAAWQRGKIVEILSAGDRKGALDVDIGCGQVPSGDASSVIGTAENTKDGDAPASIANPSPRTTPVPDEDPSIAQDSDEPDMRVDDDLGCGQVLSDHVLSVAELWEDASAGITNPSPRTAPVSNADPIVAQELDALCVVDEDSGCGPASYENASPVIESTEDTMEVESPASITNPSTRTAPVTNADPVVAQECDALCGVDEDIGCGPAPFENASPVFESTEDTMEVESPASITNPSTRTAPVPNADPIVAQESDALCAVDEIIGCGQVPFGDASSVIGTAENAKDGDPPASIANPSPRTTPVPDEDPSIAQDSDEPDMRVDDDLGCGQVLSDHVLSVAELWEDASAGITNPSPRTAPVSNADPIVAQELDALCVVDEDLGCGPASSENASPVIESTEDTMEVESPASITNPSTRTAPVPNADPVVAQECDALCVVDEDRDCGPVPPENASPVIESTADAMEVDTCTPGNIANPSPPSRSASISNDDLITAEKSDCVGDEDRDCGSVPPENASPVIESTADAMEVDTPGNIANPSPRSASISNDDPITAEKFDCVGDEDVSCGQGFSPNTSSVAEPEEAAPVLIASIASPHVVPLPSSTDRVSVYDFDRGMVPVGPDPDEAPTVNRDEARALDKGKGPAVWAIFKSRWQNDRVSFNSENRNVYPSGTANKTQALTNGSPKSLSPLQAVHCDLIPTCTGLPAILQSGEMIMIPTDQRGVRTIPTGPRALLQSSETVPIPTGPRAMLQSSKMSLIPTGPRAMLPSGHGAKIPIPTGPRAMLQPSAKLPVDVSGVTDCACSSIMSPTAPTAPRRLCQADSTMAPAGLRPICGPSGVGSPLQPPSALVVRQLNIGRDSRRQHADPYPPQQGVSANSAQAPRIRFPRPRAGKQHREQQWVRNHLPGFK
ncbi:hypothetical protein C8R43DRAFT_1143541 [Mycena crocata]|nr:hypothetical protein C8R43DRAFT_1143541 [Mycena crocata]